MALAVSCYFVGPITLSKWDPRQSAVSKSHVGGLGGKRGLLGPEQLDSFGPG